MNTIHRIFGSQHNWIFSAFSLVFLTLGLTIVYSGAGNRFELTQKSR